MNKEEKRTWDIMSAPANDVGWCCACIHMRYNPELVPNPCATCKWIAVGTDDHWEWAGKDLLEEAVNKKTT